MARVQSLLTHQQAGQRPELQDHPLGVRAHPHRAQVRLGSSKTDRRHNQFVCHDPRVTRGHAPRQDGCVSVVTSRGAAQPPHDAFPNIDDRVGGAFFKSDDQGKIRRVDPEFAS
jgi:hypothetical protein